MEYAASFDEAFSRSLQRDIIRVIGQGCEQSFRYTTMTHARPEMMSVLGHVRRAYIEQEFRNIVQLHVDMKADVQWNKREVPPIPL